MYIYIEKNHGFFMGASPIAVEELQKEGITEIIDDSITELPIDHTHDYVDGKLVSTPINKSAILESTLSGVRRQRDLELKESDWTQGADVPDSIKLPYQTYRQALRDLPSTIVEWNQEVEWPTKPE